MEFAEKLQELRKSRGLTQEELSEALFVSRTAVSKWESGRGYPSIDSLKQISAFFSVTIDDLLSSEKLIAIAENENKSNIQNLCELLFGITDLLLLLAIVLPIYPKTANGFVYGVTLMEYTEASTLNRTVYWVLFLLLIVLGAVKIIFSHLRVNKVQNLVTGSSLALSAAAVIFLALAGEAYATTLVFLLLAVKGLLIIKYHKSKY